MCSAGSNGFVLSDFRGKVPWGPPNRRPVCRSPLLDLIPERSVPTVCASGTMTVQNRFVTARIQGKQTAPRRWRQTRTEKFTASKTGPVYASNCTNVAYSIINLLSRNARQKAFALGSSIEEESPMYRLYSVIVVFTLRYAPLSETGKLDHCPVWRLSLAARRLEKNYGHGFAFDGEKTCRVRTATSDVPHVRHQTKYVSSQ